MMEHIDDMDKKIDEYCFYLIMGVSALFIIIIAILILTFVINLLSAISMGLL